MKCVVPEISWHNRDPVYTVDIQPKLNNSENFYRLATGGADAHVVIWYVIQNNEGVPSIEYAADLHRHIKGVNVVRFSGNGELLASGDDDSIIIIWRLRKENDMPDFQATNEEKEKESWVSLKVLKGHLEDIYDLCWSPDSSMLFSGSVDNTAILWDVNKAKSMGMIGEHKGFVQGVAWDPKGKYLTTMCTDRTLRIFNCQTKKSVARVTKAKLNQIPGYETKTEKFESNEKNKKLLGNDVIEINDSERGDKKEKNEEKCMKLFHDDTVKTFFRRLCFSPDGELLITPCGVMEDLSNEGKLIDVTYVFSRKSLNRPVLHLPSPGQYTVAVRCCPTLFTLRQDVPTTFSIPYRIVFAVASRSNVIFYDTQQYQPFAFVSNIHYTGLTDLTWSSDGRLLLISSSEGYCSIITFEENELGNPYVATKKDVIEEPSLNSQAEEL